MRRLSKVVERNAPLAGRLMLLRYESLCVNPRQCLLRLDDAFKERGYDLELESTAEDTSWQCKRSSTEESASELDGKPVQTSAFGNYKTVLSDKMQQQLTSDASVLKELSGIDGMCAHLEEEQIRALPSLFLA